MVSGVRSVFRRDLEAAAVLQDWRQHPEWWAMVMTVSKSSLEHLTWQNVGEILLAARVYE